MRRRTRRAFGTLWFSLTAGHRHNKKAPEEKLRGLFYYGAPGWVRTNDLQIRSLTL
jgi:hypothetical protein